ncbi:MAG: TonB-dependent receptor [Marinilabiliales bacterium]|nr:MAG: TonB-dependent receptor [Marinilabiliales bacterium]
MNIIRLITSRLPSGLSVFLTVFSLLVTSELSGAQMYAGKVSDIPVTEAIARLEQIHSVKIFFDSDWFRDQSVGHDIVDQPLDAAIETIIAGRGMEAVRLHGNFIILPVERMAARTVAEPGGPAVVGNPYESGKYTRAAVRGRVTDRVTGEDLIGVIVHAEDIGIGTTTNSAGEYSLEMPVGDHRLTLSYVGYESDEVNIRLISPGELDLSLLEESQLIDEVTVFARRHDSNISMTQMSMIRLDSETLYRLPVSMGERDIIRNLTLLPGIQTVGEFGTGFHVRGGSADQNLILVEGVPLFNSSHLFGLTSVINPDLVTDVTLIKGGIPARYGERSSSVTDIRLGGSNNDEFRLNGGIGLLNSRLSLEAPLPVENGYMVVGGRSSYSNWLLNRLPDEDLMNSAARFYDITGIAFVPIDNNNNIRLFGYYSHDGFAFSESADYNYASLLGSLRWNRVISQRVLSSLLAGHSGYRYNVNGASPLNPSNSYSLESGISYSNLKWNMNFYHSPDNTFEAGLNAIHYIIEPGNLSPYGTGSTVEQLSIEPQKAVELAGYAAGDIKITNEISAEAGIRYTHYVRLGPGKIYSYQEDLPITGITVTDSTIYGNNEVMAGFGGLEPRLSIRYQFNPSASVKMSLSRINQYINVVSNNSLPTPADVWYLSNVYQPPMISDQVAAGFFKNLFDNNVEASLEVYYKRMKNIIEPRNNASILLNSALETDLTNAKGYSYGAELYIRRLTGMLNGWVSYTYSGSYRRTTSPFRSEQINSNSYFPAGFDRPHNLVLNANLQLSRRWRLGGTFSYNTGRPVTLPELSFIHDGKLLIYFSDRNKYRLPDYHRLDLSLSFDGSLRLTRSWKSSWTISVVNVYGRKNIYSTFYERTEPSESTNYQRYSLYSLYIIGRPLPTITYNFTF